MLQADTAALGLLTLRAPSPRLRADARIWLPGHRSPRGTQHFAKLDMLDVADLASIFHPRSLSLITEIVSLITLRTLPVALLAMGSARRCHSREAERWGPPNYGIFVVL